MRNLKNKTRNLACMPRISLPSNSSQTLQTPITAIHQQTTNKVSKTKFDEYKYNQ